MEDNEIRRIAWEALQNQRPPFPEIGWIMFKDIPGLCYIKKAGDDSIEIYRHYDRVRGATEEDERIEINYNEIRLRRDASSPYPTEINGTAFSYLKVAVEQYREEGVITLQHVAQKMGCTLITAERYLTGFCSADSYLESSDRGEYRLVQLPPLFWVWGPSRRSSHRNGSIGNLGGVPLLSAPAVERLAEEVAPALVARAATVLDRAIAEVTEVLRMLESQRANLQKLESEDQNTTPS